MLSCLPIYQRTFYPLEGYFRLLPTSLPSQSGCKDTTTSFTSKYFLIFFTKIFLEQPIHPDYQYFIAKYYFEKFCESALCPILFRNSTVRFRSFARMSQAQCKAPWLWYLALQAHGYAPQHERRKEVKRIARPAETHPH